MFFQNIEFFETEQFQYLLIHKNGSSSIKKCMTNMNCHFTSNVNLNKVRWTVIRDPYERFMSGLKYDLIKQDLKLEDINKDDLYQSLVNLKTRNQGNVNHTASQIPYLINTHINWYVDLKDLTTFLKMHFNKNFLTLIYAFYNLIIVYGFLQYSVHRRFWVPYNSLFY